MEVKNIKVFISDLDGTIYQLDGINRGFKNSKLDMNVLENAKKYIKNEEQCSDDDAQKILDEALKNKIGISAFLEKRYGITRKAYFDIVWNIEPSGIVENYQEAVKKIRQIASTNATLILLTSAPKIWVEKVLDYLGIRSCFNFLFSGEDFGHKDEIFKILAKKYYPKDVLSIGDQIETDILPAKSLGFETFLVSAPSDWSSLKI